MRRGVRMAGSWQESTGLIQTLSYHDFSAGERGSYVQIMVLGGLWFVWVVMATGVIRNLESRVPL